MHEPHESCWLIECNGATAASVPLDGLLPAPLALRSYRSLDAATTYVYLDLPDCADAASLAATRSLLRDRLAQAAPGMRIDRLALIMDLPGAAHGQAASWHYVVQTDVLPEWDGQLNDWYDQEHLPGLAAVPGTVRARRYRNLDGGPAYHACYELVSKATFGSPPWAAVRATDWSSRVRPAFRNTRRTMFQRIG